MPTTRLVEMNSKIALLFVPGWTLATGSPHLALPLLSAFLKNNGLDVVTRDLNHEVTSGLGAQVTVATATDACTLPTLSTMNTPYFDAEDKLMAVAEQYGGRWNSQLGFWYQGSPERSSRNALASLDRASPFDDFYERSVVPDLLKQQPDVIGLCIASVYQIIPALQLCRLLRSGGYSGFIVLGGNTVSRLAQEMAIPNIFELVDGLLKFQGEIPMLQLCRAVQSRAPLDNVRQLIWRDENSLIRENTQQASLDPNSVPTPDYGDLPIGRYWGENYLNIVAARGCYYGKCNFCAIPYGWGNNGFAGSRSPELVFQDMVTLMMRHGISRFKFVDEALSPAFMRALSEIIIANGVKVEWEGYVRFEAAWYDDHFARLVARAGFRKGYFGLEVVPSDRRSLLNKKDRPRPERLLAVCAANDIKVHLFCMFGYPGTGEDDARETVEFLLKNQNEIDTADIFPWTYAKHTTAAGAEPIVNPHQDWALEFDHRGQLEGVLSSEDVRELASRYEELLWAEVPRFLHPTYRLVSPWSHEPMQISTSNVMDQELALV